MIREMYYEESAVPVNAMKEEKLNKGFTIAAGIFLALSVIYLFYALLVVANILADEELDTLGRVFNILFTLSFFFIGVLIAVLLLLYKRRYNVSFDYTFVEDELRISKVFNGKKRKFLKMLKADQMLKIGSCAKESFERTRAGMSKKQIYYMTPNDEPAEGKEFFYILSSTTMEKILVIIEARREILEYLVRAAGRSKYDPN